jgi:hypothetical protein
MKQTAIARVIEEHTDMPTTAPTLAAPDHHEREPVMNASAS